MERYEAIIKHPYFERQNKHVMLLKNVTNESVNTFMIVLDIAEELCKCSEEHFNKLLPIFKEFYSLVGDADTEVDFIKGQRKVR